MDNAPGASPLHYSAPIAMTLQDQDQASRFLWSIAGAIEPRNGAGMAQGWHPSGKETSR